MMEDHPTFEGPKPDTRFQRWLNWLIGFEAWMTDSFGELGFFVATNARKVQLATFVFTCVSMLGYLNATVETRPEKLWVLSGGRSLTELDYVTEQWGAPPRTMLIYFESATGGGETDVLNSEFMDVAANLHRELETIRTSSNTSYQDLCFLMPPEFRGDQLNLSVAPASAPCFVYSPLEFWPLPFSNLTTTLCSDVSSAVIQQYTRILPSPYNGFADCTEAVVSLVGAAPVKGSHGVSCDMKIPMPAWLLQGAGVQFDQGIFVREFCPVKCGGCPHSAFSAMPTVSVQDTAGLQSDSRVQSLSAQEMDVLAVGCLDAPATAIAGLSNGLITDCAELIRTFEGNCDAQLELSDQQIGQASAATQALVAQYADSIQVPEGYGGNDACWDGGSFTFERCCDLNSGATGDATCWSGDFSFTACCLSAPAQALTPAMVCPKTCAECREGDLLIGTSERVEPPAPPATPNPTRTLPLLTMNAALTLTKWGSEQLMGHRTISTNGAIVGATSLRSTYILDCGGRLNGVLTECEELESLWMEYLQEASASGRLGDVRVAYYSVQGQYLETIRSMVSAGPLFGVSLVLMTTYICSALYKGGDLAKHSKMIVGLIGTFNVVLSTVIAYGICSAFGVMITPCSPIVPFLLLGIGIDDMFVVVRSIELVPEGIPTEKRIKLALRSCGGSITVTTVTDAVAFLIGATIRFPAMQTFCIHAAVGITVVFGLTITFVVAGLAIADKGMNGDPSPLDALAFKVRKIDVSRTERRRTMGGTPQQASNITREFLKKYWAPFVKDGADEHHLAVLGVFALIGWVGVWGAFQMDQGFDVLSMLTSDSYVTDNYVTGEIQFRDVYYPFSVILREGVDYEDSAVRDEIERISVQLESVESVRADVTNWVKAYVESTKYDQRMSFMSGVSGFLNSEEGLQFSQSVIFKEGSAACFAVDTTGPTAEHDCHAAGSICAFTPLIPADAKDGTAVVPASCEGLIQASRLDSFFPGDIKIASEQAALVEEVRAIVDNSVLGCMQDPDPDACSNGTGGAFIYSSVVFLWEVWSVLMFQLVINLAETFVAIFVGTNIFLFHPTVSTIICMNVLLVEFELMGLCALFDIQLNTVTMCIFVMNFGLVFDYSAHISHMFMTTGGTRRARAAVSVTDMGSGVFNGAFTTGTSHGVMLLLRVLVCLCGGRLLLVVFCAAGLGFLPLAWAKMGICTTFAYVFMLIIFLGLVHGFIVLPLMLAQWGPDPVTIHGHGPPGTPQGSGMELE